MSSEQEESIVTLANARVTISHALRLVGTDVPDYMGRGAKLYCPFGHLYHSDGGMAKAFRVYPDTNSAYCFAGCGAFRPVSLIAADRGMSPEDAAEFLLDLTGYVPPDLDSRWAAATAVSVDIDRGSLAEALKVACAAMDSRWEVRQFEDDVAVRFRQCLGLLPRIQSGADAAQWLQATKQIMRKQLGETVP